LNVTGKGIDRVDGRLKVCGRATYAGDHRPPRLAYGVLLLSSVAAGRIVRIDSAEAERLPGVIAVLTHLNAPRLPQGGRAAVKPPAGRVLSLLQDDVVSYNNQPIGLVVGETLAQANDAVRRIVVRYARSDAVLDFEQAKRSASRPEKVNDAPPDSARGDAAGALRDSPLRMEAVYTTPIEHHNPMEPHATVAEWTGDQLTLHDSTQYVSGDKETVAKTLGVAPEQVTVICPYVGGGFGCKGSTWSHVVLAALAARQVGRPVKLVLDRTQMFGMVGNRPHTEQTLRLGAADDGRLLAMQHASVSETSTLEDWVEPSAIATRMLYAVDHQTTSHRLAKMNVATPTFTRAPGEASGTFALESAMDELAYALKMDPIALRVRNHAQRDPDKNLPFSSKSLLACYQVGADRFGWARRDARPGVMRDGRWRVGMGMATATYPTNRSAAAALVRVMPDGSAQVFCGSQDLGTGTYTIMSQVAADALGVPVGRIRFFLGDSRMPRAPVSGGSQTTASVAPAVQAAALAARAKLVAMAIGDAKSMVSGAPAEQVSIEDGQIGLRGDSGRREPLSALIARAGGQPVGAAGHADPGDAKKTHSMHAFGAVFAQVHVDPDLGLVRVPRIVGAYGIGRLLNEKTGRSQLMGGIVWGVGMALFEETWRDVRSGRYVNGNLAEYHVPVNADIGSIEIEIVPETDAVINPLGAKGIGEIGITGVAAAIGNAVYHATGRRVRDLPITLDKVADGVRYS
jgi:xanthine dehydrogenase YagR molybdenum-binding subunit